MPWVMICLGGPGIMTQGPAPLGQYLKAYDPESHGGRGFAEWTKDPGEALTFPDAGAVLQYWRQIPRSKRVRDDGKPNRPLTAFTISPVQI